MIEKSGSLRNIFKDYLRPGVIDWAEKTSDEALVDDAPEIVKDAFNEYIRKRNEKLKQGKII